MKIKKIILENIGPYANKNEFDFSVDMDKNIILIGGKNGSGKTTLLKSIKYGLFGSFSMGLKNDTAKYYEEILNLINTDNTSNKYSITIYLLIMENLIENEYCVKRNWNYDGENIEENVEVALNGCKLRDYETLEFFERLKSFTSPELINCFIFDGEKVANIIEEGKTSTFIRESFDAIFNVNLLNQLTKDLTTYLEKKVSNNNSAKETVVFNLLSDINGLKGEIKVLDQEVNTLKSKCNELQLQIKNTNKEFNQLGGISKEKRKIMLEEATSLSKENEVNMKKFRMYLENDLCFAMNQELIKQLEEQLRNEIPLNYLNQLTKIESYTGFDLSDVKKELSNEVVDKESIHKIDEDKIESLNKRIALLKKNNKFAKDYIAGKDEINGRINEIRDGLRSQEEIDKFDRLFQKSTELSANYNLFNQDLMKKQKMLDDKKIIFSKNCEHLDAINREIRKEKTFDNSFSVASNSIEITNDFIKYLKDKKLKEVSELTTEVFSDTIRKENYISRIVIEKDYNVSMYDNKDEFMSIKKLSAGEMQLIMSSIIWSMFKISGRKETFIFDTPLARLDIENRITFINNIIKTISNQVVILSTDSEFVNQNFECITSNVSNSYRLDYIEKTKSTDIVKGYF